MAAPDSPSTPDRSFVNIPVLPPPKRSPHKSPKIGPQSPTLPLPPVQSPIPTTPKSALRFPQLEPRSRSNSNTSNRSRSPSPLRKVVFSPKEELIDGGKKSKDNLPNLADLKELNQRDLKELKEQQAKDFGSFLSSPKTSTSPFHSSTPPPPPLHLDTETRSPKGRSKSVGAASSPVDITPTQTPIMHTPTSTLPSYINPVSTAFCLGLAVGLSISAIRPTLEKAVNHGSSWLAWLFKTVILWTVIGAAAYMAFTLGKAVLITIQQNQQKQQQTAHKLPPTPRSDPFEGLKPNKPSSSSGSTVSASSSKSASSTKSSGSAASIYEFNKYVDEQKVKRRGQKDEEHSFRPYPARPQLSSTAPGKIYGNILVIL
ncbi:hypothetical protein B0I72DRAFT_147958 [Yarrowia lipolytica]|uniref:Uncharacterized protein n=1 Tax=Yarrowia lipolytica TaxID=4952 RepID=A0A371C1S5_YARLL|nr:hypothetical protein B0I71DRAFT_154489 [Yarrowia lipolytica]RDW31143.1 hypothetical protein B0I72DRAFT_147958 [Yarrowia lipolytica]RDW50727.1 hypothetical protein B0I75DRAFT_154050 [Yarrowia lipolytica]